MLQVLNPQPCCHDIPNPRMDKQLDSGNHLQNYPGHTFSIYVESMWWWGFLFWFCQWPLSSLWLRSHIDLRPLTAAHHHLLRGLLGMGPQGNGQLKLTWYILLHISIYIYGYGSIPIHTIFTGMNIHLPAILMFTRGTRFWPIPIYLYLYLYLYPYPQYMLYIYIYIHCCLLMGYCTVFAWQLLNDLGRFFSPNIYSKRSIGGKKPFVFMVQILTVQFPSRRTLDKAMLDWYRFWLINIYL